MCFQYDVWGMIALVSLFHGEVHRFLGWRRDRLGLGQALALGDDAIAGLQA